jgi:hypothetical protein
MEFFTLRERQPGAPLADAAFIFDLESLAPVNFRMSYLARGASSFLH